MQLIRINYASIPYVVGREAFEPMMESGELVVRYRARRTYSRRTTEATREFLHHSLTHTHIHPLPCLLRVASESRAAVSSQEEFKMVPNYSSEVAHPAHMKRKFLTSHLWPMERAQ